MSEYSEKRLAESNEMKEKQKKKTVSVREASIVLLIIVAEMAQEIVHVLEGGNSIYTHRRTR